MTPTPSSASRSAADTAASLGGLMPKEGSAADDITIAVLRILSWREGGS